MFSCRFCICQNLSKFFCIIRFGGFIGKISGEINDYVKIIGFEQGLDGGHQLLEVFSQFQTWESTVDLLVARKNRDFLRWDFLLAEVLTQRDVMLLRGKQPDLTGQTRLLDMLHWNMGDRFLCLRILQETDAR